MGVVLFPIQTCSILYQRCKIRKDLRISTNSCQHIYSCRSNEITKDNVHENHLCCKPITAVKDLSTSDQKTLIEHDYLTLISLLPIYLDSQSNFPQKIREKTNISHDGALKLDRLMNEWGSARLFIGANSPYKTLIQTI